MDTRRLGADGPQVSVIGLGCNNFGKPGTATETNADDVVGAALQAGITVFDTADVYADGRSETLLGQALRGRRDQAFLATKWGSAHLVAPGADGWGRRGSKAYLTRAIEASLRRLQTDYLDLVQLHNPDPDTPIEETLSALQELVTAGTVRWIGHSNFTAEQMREAAQVADRAGLTGFVSAQNEYSLLRRGIEDEVLPAIGELRLGLLPFFPLASGLLTGKYRQGQLPAGTRIAHEPRFLGMLDEIGWEPLEAFREACGAFGVTMLDALDRMAARPPRGDLRDRRSDAPRAGARQRCRRADRASRGAGRPALEAVRCVDAVRFAHNTADNALVDAVNPGDVRARVEAADVSRQPMCPGSRRVGASSQEASGIRRAWR